MMSSRRTLGRLLLPLALSACQSPMPDIRPPADLLPNTATGASPQPPVFALPEASTLPVRPDPDIDPRHVYALPELIDLAQRNHPETRMAWEQARRAALAVGVVESSYLPELSAEVLGGYQHTPLPIPKTVMPRGYFTADTQELLPSLVLRWLLFDFGQRDAQHESARQLALAARAGFTGAHQKLIFDVAHAYFNLNATRAQQHIAEAALRNAQILEEATAARQQRGLATTPELAQARSRRAKANFELEQAKAADHDAYHALLDTMGLKPTLTLQLADDTGRKLPTALGVESDALIQQALAQRPDVAAALARLKASDAAVAAARARDYPSIALEGMASRNTGSVSVDNGPTYRVNENAAGLLLRFKLPLYDGGLRDHELEIARTRHAEATAVLSQVEDAAIRQIVQGQDKLNSTLAQYAAAESAETAAQTAAEAMLEAYRQGVGSFTDTSTAEAERTQAQALRARAYSAVLSAAAALAFATGELTSATALEIQR